MAPAAVGGAAFLTWFERRLLGIWQDRYGPNRLGPFGVLQVLADGVRIEALRGNHRRAGLAGQRKQSLEGRKAGIGQTVIGPENSWRGLSRATRLLATRGG